MSSNETRHTRSNALPNVDTFALWIPYPALCVYGPIEIELPDTSGITDQSWHGEGVMGG